MKFILFVGGQNKVLFFLALAIFLLFALVGLFLKNRARKNPSDHFTQLEDQFERIRRQDVGPESLTEILDLVKHYVEADGYYLYLPDENTGQYKLECVLNKEEKIKGPLKVGYSRMLPYGRQDYDPPFVLPVENFVAPSLIKENRNYIIHVSLGDSIGILRVLKPYKHHAFQEPSFQSMTEKLGEVLSELSHKQDLLISKSDMDEPNQNPVFTHDSNENCMQLIKLSSESDAVIYCSITNHYCEHTWLTGFNPQTESQLVKIENLTVIIDSLADVDVRLVDLKSNNFHQIPSCLRISYSTYVFVRSEFGILVLCYEDSLKNPDLQEYRLKFLKLLTMKLSEGTGTYKRITEKQNYFRQLMEIVRLMDDISPQTVGYSELMSGYTAMLCKEINVDSKTAVKYGRAAALSNIGLVALPEDLWNKEGVYSLKEYQSMQNHVLYGAQIIETLLSDEIMEQCIRYHHEQPDGKGYPEGLHGEDIPEGARILRVVQYYISLFKGRIYRKPLTFERIIQELKKQGGSGIDSVFAKALLYWLEKKQSNPLYKGRPLGSCYEIRCVSERICKDCPAYKRTDQFCWEFEINNCEAHGNSCSTCSVYTEYQYRNDKNVKKVVVEK